MKFSSWSRYIEPLDDSTGGDFFDQLYHLIVGMWDYYINPMSNRTILFWVYAYLV